jgi:hypothetical protein
MKTTSSVTISVIIPNFNGLRFLKPCLDSLRKQSFGDFEVIVVDNGSTDGSIEYLAGNYPEVKVRSLTRNFGFSRAVNEGIKVSRGKYIALLNNDTETDPGWLQELYYALERNPELGFCASKMINYYDRDTLDGAGDCFPRSCRPFKRGMGEKIFELYNTTKLVFGASAGAAIYRNELFETVGLFDEDFFAYFEDVDLSFRAQLLGFKCLYVPTAIVYHIGGGTLEVQVKASCFNETKEILGNEKLRERTFLLSRNRIYVIVKNVPFVLVLRYLPYIIGGLMKSFGYNLFKSGHIKQFLSGVFRGITDIPRFLSKRKLILAHKKLSIMEIDRLIKLCANEEGE